MKSSSIRFTSVLCGALLTSALVAGCGGGSSSGSPGSPAVTSAIAFVSTRDGNPEIYSMKSDGSSQTRLTTTPGNDLEPSKSPSGQKIVFSSNRDGNSEIYLMNADGSGLQRLTADTGASPPVDTQPVFSPDGNTIAWTSTRGRGNDTDIWLMDATGANQRRFTTSTETEATYDPTFSPDGTKLYFVALGPRMRYRTETLSYKSSTGGATTATPLVSNSISHLRFNPAGTKIVFADQIPNSNFGRLRVYDVAAQTVADGPSAGPNSIAQSPDYSPGGSSIIWNVAGGTTNGNTPLGQIYVSDLDGSNQRVLTSLGANSGADW